MIGPLKSNSWRCDKLFTCCSRCVRALRDLCVFPATTTTTTTITISEQIVDPPPSYANEQKSILLAILGFRFGYNFVSQLRIMRTQMMMMNIMNITWILLILVSGWYYESICISHLRLFWQVYANCLIGKIYKLASILRFGLIWKAARHQRESVLKSLAYPRSWKVKVSLLYVI